MKVNLREFLQTGTLGDLAIGLSTAEVRQILGNPEDTSIGKANRPIIWKYGALQLHFDHDHLNFVGLYFRNGEEAWPDALCWEGWMPTAQTTLPELQDHLAGVGLQTCIDLDEQDQITLLVGPGVTVIFDRGRDWSRLDSIQCAPRAPTFDQGNRDRLTKTSKR